MKTSGNYSWPALAGVAFGLAFICHLVFSRFGFNPTDDGFILAASRRIVEGQVPHMDWITMRPAGSAMTFAPLVWLSQVAGFSDYLFLASRGIVWAQWAATALAWVYITRLYERGTAVAAAVLVVMVALTSHEFPLMAWYTVDAVFWCSVGTAIALSGKRWAWCGFALIGFAVLCKHNYAPYALVAVCILPGHRH